MICLSDDMDEAQDWAPLDPADVPYLEPGYYMINGVEAIEALVPHSSWVVEGKHRRLRHDGFVVRRAVGGTAPVAHASGAWLARYHADGPGTYPHDLQPTLEAPE